jgi:ribokinase
MAASRWWVERADRTPCAPRRPAAAAGPLRSTGRRRDAAVASVPEGRAVSGRVVVVGSVNVDLVVIAPRLPGPGETVTGGDVARHHGGKGGNQAVAAARLGAPVVFVGAVGDDDLGVAARAALAAEGIDVTHLATVSRPTGVALIVVDARAENLIAVAPGANGSVAPAAVTAAFAALDIGPDDVVLACREIPPAVVAAALRAARDAGATGILNPAPADGLDRGTADLAAVVTPNASELAAIVGPGEPEAAARALLAGGGPGRAVVVTLGAAGALLVPADAAALAIPAARVVPVDTVGAGDTFNGALAAGLAGGLALDEACRRAVAAAGLSTTRPGARGGMPTTAELEGHLEGG